MLRELQLHVVAVFAVLFVTFWERWMAWGILCAYYHDVILDDALSSNPRNLVCQVARKFDIVGGSCDLVASGISCPSPWFVWVVFCHWWRCLPLRCQFVEALAVACVLILRVSFWCILPRAPWCKVLPVPLRWQMTWCFWLCVQCWVPPQCLVVQLCCWRERSVHRLCCALWACLNILHCCGLLIPYCWHGKRVRRLPARLGNQGVEGFASLYPWLDWMIVMRWRWLGKGGCCPLFCQGIRICRILVGWIIWPCSLIRVLSIPALHIASWHHTELGRTGKVHIDVYLNCVGIVLMLWLYSLALTNVPGGLCSSSLM